MTGQPTSSDWADDFLLRQKRALARKHPDLYRQLLQAEAKNLPGWEQDIWAQAQARDVLAEWRRYWKGAVVGVLVGLALLIFWFVSGDNSSLTSVAIVTLADTALAVIAAIEIQFKENDHSGFWIFEIAKATPRGVRIVRWLEPLVRRATKIGVILLYDILALAMIGACLGLVYFALVWTVDRMSSNSGAPFTALTAAGGGIVFSWVFLGGLLLLNKVIEAIGIPAKPDAPGNPPSSSQSATVHNEGAEQMHAFWRKSWRSLLRGVVLGGAASLIGGWAGIFAPWPGDAGWYWLALMGTILGGFISTRKFMRQDLETIGLTGAVIGAAVGFATAALGTWIMSASYDAASNQAWAFPFGALGAMIAVWRAHARAGRYPIARHVLGALIAAAGGAGIVLGSYVLLSSPNYLNLATTLYGPLFRLVFFVFPGASGQQAARVLVVIGGAFGLAVYLWWQRRRPTLRRNRGRFSLFDFAVNAGTRAKLLATGLTALIVSGIPLFLLWSYGTLDLFPNAGPWVRWGYVVVAVLVLLYFAGVFAEGLGSAGRGLRPGPKLGAQDLQHGDARLGTDEEGEAAARGVTGRPSPVSDHRKDY